MQAIETMTMTGVRPGDRDRDEDPQVEDDADGDDLFSFLMDCPRKPANLTKNRSGGKSGGGVVHPPLKKMHRQRECGEGGGMEMIMEKRKAAKRHQGIASRSLLSKRNHNTVPPAAEIDCGGRHMDFDISDFSLSQEGEPGATMESITAMERSYGSYNKARQVRTLAKMMREVKKLHTKSRKQVRSENSLDSLSSRLLEEVGDLKFRLRATWEETSRFLKRKFAHIESAYEENTKRLKVVESTLKGLEMKCEPCNQSDGREDMRKEIMELKMTVQDLAKKQNDTLTRNPGPSNTTCGFSTGSAGAHHMSGALPQATEAKEAGGNANSELSAALRPSTTSPMVFVPAKGMGNEELSFLPPRALMGYLIQPPDDRSMQGQTNKGDQTRQGFCGGGDPEANNLWSRPHSGINNGNPKFGTGAFDEMLRWSLKDMEAMLGERDGLPLDALNKVSVDQKDDNLSNFFLRLGVSCTPLEKNIHPDDIEKGTQREGGHPLVSEQQAGDSSNLLRKQKSPTDTETGPENKPGSDNFPYGVSGGAVGGPRGLKGMSSSSMASEAAEEPLHTGCLSAGDLLWMELRMAEAQFILQQGCGASKPQTLPNYIARDKDAKQNDHISQKLGQPDDSDRKRTMSGAGPDFPPPAAHDDDNHTCRGVAPADGCTGSPSSRVPLQEKSKSQADTASAAVKEDATNQVRTDAEVDRPLGKSSSLESTRTQEVDSHQSGISDCQRGNSKDSESISRVDESGSKHSMCCSEQAQFPMAALGELRSDKPPSNRETAKRHQTTVMSTENDAVDCTKCEKVGVEKAVHQSARPCEPTNLSPFSGVQTGQHPVSSLNAIQCLPQEGTPDHKCNFAKVTEEGGREEVEGEEEDAVAETGSQRMDRVNHHDRVVVGESSKSEQADNGVDNADRNSNLTEEGRKEKAGGEHDAVLGGDDDAVLGGDDDAVLRGEDDTVLRGDDDAVIESAFKGVERVSHHITGESGKSERVQSVDDTDRNSNSGHAHVCTTQERDRVTLDQMSEHGEGEGRQQHPVRSAPANAKAPTAGEKFGFNDDRWNGVTTRKKDQVQTDESWEPGVEEQGKRFEPKMRAATDEKEVKVAGKSARDEDQMTTGVTTGKKDRVQTDGKWEYGWGEQDKRRHPVRREPADVKATKAARTTASDKQRMTEVRSKISSVFDFVDDDDDNGEPEVQAKDDTWQPAKTASALASLRRVNSVNGHRNVRDTPTDGARDGHQRRRGVTFMDVDANERQAGKDRSADGNSTTNQTSERSSSRCDTGARSQGRTSDERSQAVAAAGPKNAAMRVLNKNAECDNRNAQQNLDRRNRGNNAAFRDMPTGAIRLRRTHRNLTEKEVEKLVEGFKSLGPGRWSAIKERWFAEDNDLLSSDLKDKWRSLVLAAKRPPQERRRKTFPAELYKRILDASSSWADG